MNTDCAGGDLIRFRIFKLANMIVQRRQIFYITITTRCNSYWLLHFYAMILLPTSLGPSTSQGLSCIGSLLQIHSYIMSLEIFQGDGQLGFSFESLLSFAAFPPFPTGRSSSHPDQEVIVISSS